VSKQQLGYAHQRAVRKAERDVVRVKHGMRFVITIRVENREHVVRVHHNEHYAANGIAILATAYIGDAYLREALVGEIGCSRGAPYARTGRTIGRGRYQCMPMRRRVRKMHVYELALIWPLLEEVFAHIMTELRRGWVVKEAWHTRRGPSWERGAHATVALDDRLLSHQIALEDFLHRKHKYLDRYVALIKRWLGKYTMKRGYSAKQLRKLRGVQKTADFWAATRLTFAAREYIFYCMSTREERLLREILRLYELPGVGESSQGSLPERHLPELTKVRLYIRPKERTRHARGCVVFEILPIRKKG